MLVALHSHVCTLRLLAEAVALNAMSLALELRDRAISSLDVLSQCGNHVQAEARDAQKEAGQQRALAAHAANSSREAEKRLERCRSQLAAAVAREERTLARNKEVYSRVRTAWAATKGTPKAPGAVAAAARELRAIEIVGIYEHAKASSDAELARLAALNDSLTEEVRQLQNKAALLARERGTAGAASAEVRRHHLSQPNGS